MKIGIFGCTADPFTCAHYEIVKSVLERKLVDKVVIIPTVVDYYRKEKGFLFTHEDRKTILKEWFEGEKRLENVILDFYEYDLVKELKDYSVVSERRYVDMLEDMSKRYGNSEYYTIIGEDSYLNFKTWSRWTEILEKSKLIVIKRDVGKTVQFKTDEEYRDYQETVPVHDFISIGIDFSRVSATEIRKRLEDDMSAMSLGPSTTCLDLYLEEVDDYLKTGKSYEDRRNEWLKAEKEAMRACEDYLKNTKEQVLAKTPIFDVVEGKEFEEGFRPVRVKSKDWVTIVVEKDGQFLMETQFRHGLQKEFEEFPCGMVEEGENPVNAAFRELKEETGIVPKKYTMTYLGKYAANPAFMTNYMHYFYIELKNCDTINAKLDSHEHLISYWKDKHNAFEEFLNSDGSVLMGSCWMLLIKEGIINEWNN